MSETVVAWLFGGWLLGSAEDPSEACQRLRKPTRGEARNSGHLHERDTQWVARLQADDDTALRETMEAYFSDLVRFAARYVHTDDVAYDVVQDSYVRFWERRHAFPADLNIRAYLLRTVRNRALNMRRQHTRSTTYEQAAAEESYRMSPYSENMGISQVEHLELQTLMRQVAESLSPRLREAFLLYMEQGLSPVEIAAIRSVAVGTVYIQLRKALNLYSLAIRQYWG